MTGHPSGEEDSAFAARGLAPIMLSRIADGLATPTSALIPWNSRDAYTSVTLGVARVTALYMLSST